MVPFCLLICDEESDKVQVKCLGKSCNKNTKHDHKKILEVMGILLAEENASQYAKKTSVIMKKKHIKFKKHVKKAYKGEQKKKKKPVNTLTK